MSTPLPSYFTPHVVSVRDLQTGGGMGDTYAAARDVAAFAEDEQKVVRNRDGAEVVSTSQVHVNFDEAIPVGSLVTVWPGMTGEREAVVLAVGRFEAPGWPAFQTLSLA